MLIDGEKRAPTAAQTSQHRKKEVEHCNKSERGSVKFARSFEHV